MSSPKRRSSNRPNLYVEIDQFQRKSSDFINESPKNNVAIKPLRSGKNAHELKKFNFDPISIDQVSAERDLRRIQQLEQERCTLKQKIEVLTAGAVSAIAEKEDQIEKLRVFDHISLEEKLEYYQGELERWRKAREEAEEEKEQLYREFQQERAQHISELEQKEELIQAMYQEMLDIRRNLENLEHSDLTKSKKIKLLQEQNSKLSLELEQLSLTCSITQIADRLDLDETIKREAQSVLSSIHSHPSVSLIESADVISLDGQQSQLSDKIEQINKVHKEDIIELRNFYEKRIAALRGIYEKELNLPTEQNQKDQVHSHTSNLTKRNSKRSLRAKQQQPDYGLNLNLKDMYAIEERAQEILQTQRTKMHDLKYEIKMQNLSECPSIEPRLHTQEDMDAESVNSHFTTKYFQPRFLRMNKSSSTFNPEEKTVLKISHRASIDEKSEDQSVQHTIDENFWTKTKIFAFGVLSGVTVTALSSLIFKKSGN